MYKYVQTKEVGFIHIIGLCFFNKWSQMMLLEPISHTVYLVNTVSDSLPARADVFSLV